MGKVKFDANAEWQYISNFKILQSWSPSRSFKEST
jgi:hypothetical protein